MKIKELFKRKSVQVVFCVLSALLCGYYVYGFVDMVRTTHTRYVERDFIAALDQLQRSPPGTARVETFVTQLKAIHTDYAPEAVKQGLRDYISALQQSVDALKKGGDPKPYENALAMSKARLVAACKKYECN